MIESKNDASRNLEKALQALEQAKQRVANEKKKKNEKKRRSTGFVCARQGQDAGAAGGLREAGRREGSRTAGGRRGAVGPGDNRTVGGLRVSDIPAFRIHTDSGFGGKDCRFCSSVCQFWTAG